MNIKIQDAGVWVKTSELKEINWPLCIRYDGGGAYWYDTVCSMEELQKHISEFNPIEEIEWLKPVEQSQQPEIDKLISDYKYLLANFTSCPQIIIDNPSFVQGKKPTEKDMEWAREKIKEYEADLQFQQPKDLQDLQVQVRDHIRNHNLFDWEEALTDNEMIYLENLLLTFNPLCPPGSIGFKEQKKHISNQSQQPKEAESDAVEFAEWLTGNGYTTEERYWFDKMGEGIGTTKELYKLFKKPKP